MSAATALAPHDVPEDCASIAFDSKLGKMNSRVTSWSRRALLAFALTALALSASGGRAAPPASLIGSSYEEAGESGPLNWESNYFFFPNATVARQVLSQYRSRMELLWQHGPLPDAPYTYHVVDAATATLQIGSRTRTLTFTDGHRGTWTDGHASGEFWLRSPLSDVPLVNSSNRARIDPTYSSITGFVHTGSDWRWLVIRVVGPGLAAFDVAAPAPNPRLTVMAADGSVVASNDDWSATHPSDAHPPLARLAEQTGAFPLPVGSKDAGLALRLPPGAYTVIASTADGSAGGEVLTEIYVAP